MKSWLSLEIERMSLDHEIASRVCTGHFIIFFSSRKEHEKIPKKYFLKLFYVVIVEVGMDSDVI